jgi:putative transposase
MMGLMTEYRHGSRSVFEIPLHLVWVTKYRKPVRSGAVGVRVRDLIREICGVTDVLLIKGHVSKDHVHLLVSIAPQVTISRLVPRLKGKTAYKRLGEFGHIRKEFWGRHEWARGYFCCSSGNVTDEVVAASIENQGRGQSGDFRVEEGGESLEPALGRRA